jgi:hypothetical protein
MFISVFALALAVVLAGLTWAIGLRRSSFGKSLDDRQRPYLHSYARAFALLIDRNEEAYLRQSLPRPLFLSVQRRRARLAKECVTRMSAHAAVLLQSAQMAAYHSDPVIAANARQLWNRALQVKLNALLAVWCLRLKWIFPAADIRVPSRYLLRHLLVKEKLSNLATGHSRA